MVLEEGKTETLSYFLENFEIEVEIFIFSEIGAAKGHLQSVTILEQKFSPKSNLFSKNNIRK